MLYHCFNLHRQIRRPYSIKCHTLKILQKSVLRCGNDRQDGFPLFKLLNFLRKLAIFVYWGTESGLDNHHHILLLRAIYSEYLNSRIYDFRSSMLLHCDLRYNLQGNTENIQHITISPPETVIIACLQNNYEAIYNFWYAHVNLKYLTSLQYFLLYF